MLKGKTPLLVALALALCAGAIAYLGIEAEKAKVRRGWTLVPGVVVATKAIPEGSVITLDMVAERAVPEQFVTSSMVKVESISRILDQTILVSVQAGDPILWTQFDTTRFERLSTKVQPKMRAVTIEAAKDSSVGGWVRPNDHVDVIGTFRDPQSNEPLAVTLLQNVIVLATGKITGTTKEKLLPESQREYSDVSLLVIPEEAEILVLAKEMGTLTLSLRNEGDGEGSEERGRGANINTLLSGDRAKFLEKKRKAIIEVIPGTAKAIPGAQ